MSNMVYQYQRTTVKLSIYGYNIHRVNWAMGKLMNIEQTIRQKIVADTVRYVWISQMSNWRVNIGDPKEQDRKRAEWIIENFGGELVANTDAPDIDRAINTVTNRHSYLNDPRTDEYFDGLRGHAWTRLVNEIECKAARAVETSKWAYWHSNPTNKVKFDLWGKVY